MTRATRRSGLALLIAWSLACGGAPPAPIISQNEISMAEQSGELEALHARAVAAIAAGTASPEQLIGLRAVQRELGDKLAARLDDDVRRALTETPRVVGVLPLITLEEQRARLEPMREWSPASYDALADELGKESHQTKAALAEREAQLVALAQDDVTSRLRLLDELIVISGATSEQAVGHAARRREILDGLSREAAAAIEAENYDEAQRMLMMVHEVDPSDSGTTEKLATVETKVFERDFFQALENGEPDRGYAALNAISSSSTFPLIAKNLAGSKDVMADYYVSLGKAATAKGDVPAAYRRFTQARKIRALLGETEIKPPVEEKAFITLLHKEYQAAKKKDRMGLAWGFLHVMTAMKDDTPTMLRNLRETREIVLQRAIKRISVSPFEDPRDSSAEFGNEVASKVVQHLFRSIPNDIGMIEREQLSDIMREKTIGKGDAAADAGLAAANYLVQGTILEAKVDSSEKKGKKTQRIITERLEQPNPEHNAWMNMSSKERKNRPEPPATVMVERKEDVTTEVTLHRKVGIFSVSFRVIDAATAKVVFADSAREKAQHEDTSTEGVELGEFREEFKLASLPSDIEILANLADKVSAEIGAALAKVLANPELAYVEDADRFAREANYAAAAETYAYAVVLSERKDQDVSALLEKLRDSSIKSIRR